jgi:hypothetical protein
MLSAMAGVTWWNFYFRLFPGAIRSPQIIEFLGHLLRHIPGKLLIILGRIAGPSQRRHLRVHNAGDCGSSFFPATRQN